MSFCEQLRSMPLCRNKTLHRYRCTMSMFQKKFFRWFLLKHKTADPCALPHLKTCCPLQTPTCPFFQMLSFFRKETSASWCGSVCEYKTRSLYCYFSFSCSIILFFIFYQTPSFPAASICKFLRKSILLKHSAFHKQNSTLICASSPERH